MAEFIAPSLAVILASPFIGSFIANLAVRLPQDRQVWTGRSICPACSETLRAVDLVPVLSWLKLRGRCFHCNETISIFYPAVEASTFAIALWSAQAAGGWLMTASFGLGCALLASALIDAQHFWLPDILTLPLIPAGLLTARLLLPDHLIDHIIGAAAGFMIFYLISKLYYLCRAQDGLGLGDAKLLAGLGAWVAWPGLPWVIGLAACGGLGFIVCHSIVTRRPVRTGARIPFGPFLALAGWLTWLYSPETIFTGLS